jgi:hypothetical protein
MSNNAACLWLYAPLWGVAFDSDGVGLLGGATFASVPHEEEWRTIQRTAVADERTRLAMTSTGGPTIPLCLTVVTQLSDGQDPIDAVNQHRPAMLAQLRRAVLTLRLHQAGWFLDPELAEVAFAVVDGHWRITRQPGPYRQTFLVPDADMPFPAYALKVADLSHSEEETGALTSLWNRLTRCEQAQGSAPVQIALDSFSRSYSFQVDTADRVAWLFMALESVVGGLSGKAPGEVELRGPGARAYRRIKAALVMHGMDIKEAGRQAAWVCGNEPGEGRWLRNRVAHGDPVDAKHAPLQSPLQEIVRAVLCCAVNYFGESSATSACNPDMAPIGAFNLMLAQHG